MNIEHEATFTHIDKGDVRKKLVASDATMAHPEALYKRYIFHPPVGIRGHVRVRDEGGKTTFTLKQKIENSELSGNHWKEVETNIDSIEVGCALAEGLGCKQKAYQETLREKWILDGVEVTIDTWPFLEPYVEVEGRTMEEVQRVSEKLGFIWKDALFVNVTDLYMKEYDVTKEFINDQTPRITFWEENPFLKND